ncbi:MAG: hypothetical protein Q8N18_25415 [Opitutaceae bacterium]|nr:hypothetical protein [Opitutaceae bacterium]
MTPQNVANNTSVLRNTVTKFPFDGIVIYSVAGSGIFDPVRVAVPRTAAPTGADYAAVCATEFAPLSSATFAGTDLQHNLAGINTYAPVGGDPFVGDPVIWTTTLSRMSTFASRIDAQGFKGFWIDIEDYAAGTQLFVWPRLSQPTYTASYPNTVVATARRRGREIMAAIRAGFPNEGADKVVMTTSGLHRYINGNYYADPANNNSPRKVTPAENQAAQQKVTLGNATTDDQLRITAFKRQMNAALQAAFFVGLVEGRGPVKVVDGMEGYSQKSWADFDPYYYQRTKYSWPLTNSLTGTSNPDWPLNIIPSDMVPTWPENVSIGNATNDLSDTLRARDPVSVVQAQITYGMRRADDYAWYYSEGNYPPAAAGFDLTLPPNFADGRINPDPLAPSAALIAAIRDGRATALAGITSRNPGQVWLGANFESPNTAADLAEFLPAPTTGTWVTQATTRLGAATTAIRCDTTGVAVVAASSTPNGRLTWTDYEVTAWVRADNTLGDRGILGRYKDANNYFQLVLLNGTEWALYKRIGGTVTLLHAQPYPWIAGVWYNLKLSFNGRDISVSISTDGVNFTPPVIKRDHALTSGTVALKTSNSTASFDDVVVRVAAEPALSDPSAQAPVFASQPVSQSIGTGSTVVFNAVATGAASYRWQRDGVDLANATSAYLVIKGATAAHAGTYTVVVANSSGSTTSAAATLTVSNVAPADLGRLINLSILTNAGAGAKVLTVGAVAGPPELSDGLPLVVRAVGPTLNSAFGLAAVLRDPVMTVNAVGVTAPIVINDNWGGGATMRDAFKAVGAFELPTASLDSAALLNATAGGYTVQIAGKGGDTGLVIAEIYDGSIARSVASPRLVNLSTLAQIEPGASLTAGFVLQGATGRTVLVRGVGPSLGRSFGIAGAMTDPTLELFRNATGAKIAENNDWGGDGRLADITASVGAFALAGADSKDAVLLVTLSPGAYSARVNGNGASVGTAIVEIYEVP